MEKYFDWKIIKFITHFHTKMGYTTEGLLISLLVVALLELLLAKEANSLILWVRLNK